MSALDLIQQSVVADATNERLRTPTGFGDVFSANVGSALLDIPTIHTIKKSSSLYDRDEAIKSLGLDYDFLGETRTLAEQEFQNDTSMADANARQKRLDDILDQQILAQRDADPERWGNIKTNAEIAAEMAEKHNTAEDIAAQKAERGDGVFSQYVAPLAGGITAGMVDPINIATMPFGFGVAGTGFKAFAKAAGLNALVNMGVEAALIPQYKQFREEMGRPITNADAVKQVLLSGAATVGLSGVGKALELTPQAAGYVARSLRGKRKKLQSELETVMDAPDAPQTVKTEAQTMLREVDTVLDYPPQLEDTLLRTQYEGVNVDDVTLRDSLESDAIDLHKAALIETADALANGRQPEYHPLLLDTDIPYRNYYKVPEQEVAKLVAQKKAATPDFAAMAKEISGTRFNQRNDSLLEFISKRGGMYDDDGELTSLGAHEWHKQRKFRRKLVRERGDAGKQFSIIKGGDNDAEYYGLDTVARAAQEAGYFTGDERPTINDLLDKIDAEMRGNPTYPYGTETLNQGGERAIDADEEQFRYEQDIRERAEARGIATEGKAIEDVTDALLEYEARTELQQKYFNQEQRIATKADEIYRSLIKSGMPEEQALANHALFVSTYHAFMRNYGIVSDDIEAIIANRFEGIDVISDRSGDIRYGSSRMMQGGDTFEQSTRAELGITEQFNEADYRLSVTAWAKAKFGDKTAPDGSLAWQNFTQWFGDSKVVDGEGKPLVVYHGTRADINEDFAFSPKKIGENATAEGYGFYFTTDVNTAKGYQPENGGSLAEAYLRIEKPMSVDAKKIKKTELVKIIKQMVERQIAKYSDEISDYKDSFLSDFVDTYSINYNSAVKEVADTIFENNENALDQLSELVNVYGDKIETLSAVRDVTGFDAVISDGYGNTGVEGGTIYVAWFPEQIKSTFNKGAFSPDDARILYQRAAGDTLETMQSRWTGEEYGSAETSIYEGKNDITIGKIDIDKKNRSKGYGTKIMNELIAYADSNGKRIILTASTDFGGSSVKRLKDFYKRFGFVENKGKNKDFSIRETMYREPQKLYQRTRTPDTSTPSLDGFEPISQRQLIERKMEGKSQPKKPQKGMTGETNLFDQSELAQDSLFQQAKGSITFTNARAFIELAETADASTFTHEMGHFYMRTMHDIAAHPDAPVELMQDYKSLRDFVGAKEGARFTVEQEEKIARAWEQYIREGKAPSEGLRGVFYKMAMWMREVYRSARDLGVELTPEIRQVFDKWAAPEQGQVRTFVDTPTSFIPTLDNIQPIDIEPAAIMDANMAEFMRIARDFPDERIMIDDGSEITFTDFMKQLQADEQYLTAMTTCAR